MVKDRADLLKTVSKKLKENKLRLVTAESCTGGWLAKQITDLAGSSAIFDRGFVTYSNESKQEMLGVKKSSLDLFGAVSEQVVLEMAEGALKLSNADISVSISGVAGPEGGSEEKPVGTVWFGFKVKKGAVKAIEKRFDGDREKVRIEAVKFALTEIEGLAEYK